MPLFKVNGKITSKDAVEQIDADNIKQMSVMKGATAVKKHGDKAKNGVVEIITK